MNAKTIKAQAIEEHSTKKPKQVYVKKRPCFVSLSQKSEVLFEDKKDKETHPTQSIPLESDLYYFELNSADGIRIASHIELTAITCDENGNNFGRTIEIKSSLGHFRRLTIPMDLFAGNGGEWQRLLLNAGVEISQIKDAKNKLANYLQTSNEEYLSTHGRELPILRCTNRTGWYEECFVLPDRVIGESEKSKGIVYQTNVDFTNRYTQKGDLDSWKSDVAKPAENNPILAFAISCAFAGPLLEIVGGESGGFHIFGNTSSGKSTVLEASASVWGNPRSGGFMQTWRATANGLEAVCYAHNDCLLPLDEVSQADPRSLPDIVYMIGNEMGKSRMSKALASKASLTFRNVVLSTGEQPIAQAIREGGHSPKGGHEIRILDIDGQRQHGVFDQLPNDYANGAELSKKIKDHARHHYGHAGIAYIEYLIGESKDKISAAFNVILGKFKSEFPDVSGANERAMRRFAVVALAGELAIYAGITGWAKGKAIDDCAEVFRHWLSNRPAGDTEAFKAEEALRDYINKHESRFEYTPAREYSNIIQNRAGYIKEVEGSKRFMFFSESFAEALKGLNINSAKKYLANSGILIKAPDGSFQIQTRLPNETAGKRLYHIDSSVLFSGKVK